MSSQDEKSSTRTSLPLLSTEYKTYANEKDKYKYVYYQPSIPAVLTEEKGCVMPDGDATQYKLKMTALDDQLHTFETCKFGASMNYSAIKANEKNRIDNGDIVKKRGLPFKVVDGYFADNPSFFNGKPNVNPDGDQNSVDFTSLNAEIGGSPTYLWDETKVKLLNKHDGHYFSIEWFGQFVPNQTGKWEFYLESDDASYLWIGEKALNDYTVNNADVKNGGLHGMRGVASLVSLTKDVAQPIRIQFGENWGGRNLILIIKNPQGQIVNPYDVFFYYETKSGEKYEFVQSYIALVEDTPENSKRNLFRCLVVDDTAENRSTLRNANSETIGNPNQSVVYKTAWTALNEQDPTENQKTRMGNTLVVTKRGGLFIMNNGSVIKKIVNEMDIPETLNLSECYIYLDNYRGEIIQWNNSLSPEERTMLSGGSGNNSTGFQTFINSHWRLVGRKNGYVVLQKHRLVLDVTEQKADTHVVNLQMQIMKENGWQKREDVPEFFKPVVVKNAVSVQPWEQLKNRYQLMENNLKTDQMLMNFPDEGSGRLTNENILPFVLSGDNRFKLFVNEQGNVKLMFAQKACQNRQTMRLTNGEPMSFTYTDTANHELYLYRIDVNEKMGNIQYLNAKEKTISAVPRELYDYSGKTYTNFGEYIPHPSSSPQVLQKTEEECKTSCNADTTCNKYYSYVMKDGVNQCVIGNDNNIKPVPMQNNPSVTSAKMMLKTPNIKDVTSNDPNKMTISYEKLKFKNSDVGWVEEFTQQKSTKKNANSSQSFVPHKKREGMENGTFTDKTTVTEIQCELTGDANNVTAVGGSWTDITAEYIPQRQFQIPTWQNKPLGMTGLALSGDQNTVLVSNWWSTGCVYFSKKNPTTGFWSPFKRTLHYFPNNPKQGSVLTDDRWYWMGILGLTLSFDGTVGAIINPGGACYWFTWDEQKQNYTMGTPLLVEGQNNNAKWWVSLDMVRNPNPAHVNVNNLVVATAGEGIYIAKWDKQSRTYGGLQLAKNAVGGRNCLGMAVSSDGNTIAYSDYNNIIYIAKYDGVSNFINEMKTETSPLPKDTRNLKFSTDVNAQGFPNVLFYTTLDFSIYDRNVYESPTCMFISTWNGTTYGNLKPIPKNIIPSKLDMWGLCVCPNKNDKNTHDVYAMSIAQFPNPIYKVQVKTTVNKYTRLNENVYKRTDNYVTDGAGIYGDPNYKSWVQRQKNTIVGENVSTNINTQPTGSMSSSFTTSSGAKSMGGSTQQGFCASCTEGFTQYNTNVCTNDPNSTNCIDFINTQKIDPLLHIVSEHNQKQQNINLLHEKTKRLIDENQHIKRQMTADETLQRKYRYDASHNAFDKEQPTMADAIKQDLNELIIRQNQLFTMGAIATASVVVLAVMIGGSK